MRNRGEKSLYPESHILLALFMAFILLFSNASAFSITHVENSRNSSLTRICASQNNNNMEFENSLSDIITKELETNLDYRRDAQIPENTPTVIPMFQNNPEHPQRGSIGLDEAPPRPSLDALVVHGPIQIYDDTDFVTQGWPGSGIAGDPYVISNLEITTLGDGRDCIEIRNTRSHFRIQGCHLIGYIYVGHKFGADGVKLFNVSNGQIWGNEVNDHGDPGILLSNSSFCDIDGNTCYDNDWGGVNLYNSFNNPVTDNNCVGEDHHGMVISKSGDNIIFGNDVSTSDWKSGLFIEDCLDGNNSISFNTANGCDHGIAIVD
ncbi:MAG: right-handed parallel beta-helix repeat-containing protein, partial [Candidatus Thorarchaeota archaeon]|nr:right-handed parallel beta-helix repeat-containing protein [Candidatus Thorarchaeota archaeon]